jgi:hypothetical protein
MKQKNLFSAHDDNVCMVVRYLTNKINQLINKCERNLKREMRYSLACISHLSPCTNIRLLITDS